MDDSTDTEPRYAVKAFRLKNFMGFADTGWIELKPVTLLFGRNSSGKSSLIRGLRFLGQNVDLPDGVDSLFLAREGGVDLGRYKDVVLGHRIDLPLTVGFKVSLPEEYRNAAEYPIEAEEASIQVAFSYDKISQKLGLIGFSLHQNDGETDEFLIFRTHLCGEKPTTAHFSEPVYGTYWSLESTLFEPDLGFKQNLWEHVQPKLERSFVPVLDIPGAVTNPHDDRKQYEGRGDDFTFVTGLLRHFRTQIEAFMRSLTYIGPIRDEPRRFYYVPQQIAASVGNRGQFSISLILSQTSAEEIQAYTKPINDWLLNSSLQCSLHISLLSQEESLYAVTVKESSGFDASLQDVGFGISQLLPVLIESTISQSNRFIIIEQPELHLHPQAQAELGDLFAVMAARGLRFLLETHSEHLMLRFRRRIAEATQAKLEGREPRIKIDNGEFSLLFIRRGEESNSEVEPVFVNHYGHLVEPSREFREFFEDDYVEFSELSKANIVISALEKRLYENRA